jgi:hypothetical protein
MRFLSRWLAAMPVAAGLVVLVLATALVTRAQQATPAASPVAVSQTSGGRVLPAAIHNGTCAQLGDIAYQLADVGLPQGAQPVGQPAIPAYQGITEVPGATLDDLINGQFALAVHESAQAMQNLIACGDIGGSRFGDTVLFGVGQLNNSGYGGVALISANPNGGLNVVVYLTSNAGSQATASPIASPVAGG